jgi:hypothetical protein
MKKMLFYTYKATVSFIKNDKHDNLVSKVGSASDVKIWSSQLIDLLSWSEGIKHIQLKIDEVKNV